MAKVNYVRENTAFIEYASDEHVTANERLLWYALFHLMNRRAIGSDWPDEPISISNARLLSLVPFSEDSLAKARNRLVQRGLIRYEPGKKNTASPRYAINYFCAELSTGNAQNVDVYPDTTGNIGGNVQGNNGGNIGGNMQGNNGGNIGGNMGGIIYKPNGIPEHNPVTHTCTKQTISSSSAVLWLSSRWEKLWCRRPDERELRGLAELVNAGYEGEHIVLAMGKAFENADSSPVGYMVRTLEDWKRYGIPKRMGAARTEERMQRRTAEERAESSRACVIDLDVGEDEE